MIDVLDVRLLVHHGLWCLLSFEGKAMPSLLFGGVENEGSGGSGIVFCEL